MDVEWRAEDFVGRWTVARSIADRIGPDARFDGSATFERAAEGWLDYAERGTLTVGDAAPMVAERAYRWRIGAEGGEVRFADGRPFHAFGWGDGLAEHACGADHYTVRYDFARWPAWRAVWRVTGPRKDYVMTTDYLRG